MAGWLGVGVGGWLDQVGIRLNQLSTGLKVEAELGNIFKQAGAELCQALNPSHNYFRRFSALNTYLGAFYIL